MKLVKKALVAAVAMSLVGLPVAASATDAGKLSLNQSARVGAKAGKQKASGGILIAVLAAAAVVAGIVVVADSDDNSSSR